MNSWQLTDEIPLVAVLEYTRERLSSSIDLRSDAKTDAAIRLASTERPDASALARALVELAAAREEGDALVEAEYLYRYVLGLGEHEIGMAMSRQALYALADNLHRQGRFPGCNSVLIPEVAAFHRAAGRLDDADRALQHARLIAEAALEECVAETASIYHSIADLARAQGEGERSEDYLRRAFELRRAVFGADHPEVVADGAALAAWLVGQGMYDEAEPLLRTAVLAFEASSAPDSYDLAVNAHHLATVLAERGGVDEATQLYERALAIKRHVLGPSHPAVATTLHNLALLYNAAGSSERASALWAEARAVLEPSP